jgi:hypothetical protein
MACLVRIESVPPLPPQSQPDFIWSERSPGAEALLEKPHVRSAEQAPKGARPCRAGAQAEGTLATCQQGVRLKPCRGWPRQPVAIANKETPANKRKRRTLMPLQVSVSETAPGAGYWA